MIQKVDKLLQNNLQMSLIVEEYFHKLYFELLQLLPNENIVYFGDTARVPYGPKSNAVVREYTRDDVNILLQHNVKMIVVACNTVSAVALDVVMQMSSIPVIGMIAPGAEFALKNSSSKQIGIIGTVWCYCVMQQNRCT